MSGARRFAWTVALLAGLASAPDLAAANTIDFASLPFFSTVTNQFACVVFSLAGGPDSPGDPTILGGGLTNSHEFPTDGQAITQNILDIAFPSGTTGVSFEFASVGDNTNLNGAVGTFYIAFDGSTVVGSGSLASASLGFTQIDLTGLNTITDLQINNSCGASGCNNGDWIFIVSQLDYSPLAATPLPAALPLFATGLGALGLLGWGRKRKAR